ncbi:MAG: hypothetical protein SGI99_02755 [Pseudomonadota bacterium]|nr:hypothetical protein [Pseudomonadota bacterium]
MRYVFLALFSLIAMPLAAVDPFHAPAATSGSVDVTLHATEVVTANTAVVAGFGVPFPRGSITAAGLANLRVMSAGVEIPAYVIELTPWRHRSNVTIDGQSVRVALVQVEVAFANTALPKTITVEWGGPARILNRPTRAVRATTWHQVTSGSFVAVDNVFEPNVLAQLPADWLSRGALRTSRTLPFDASNGAARDDPATMDAITTWPGTQEAERALKNNFYTTINQDDPLVTTLIAYKTTREPWLYDRSANMFTLYFRSGSVKALREALRSTDFYRSKLTGAGAFTIEAGDSKYSYNESLAYAYWSTGDATFLPAISTTANQHNGTVHVWTPQVGFWTERGAAFKLMAHAIDYEVTGSVARRDSVNAIIQGLVDHQNGAALPIPMQGRIDGGWYHTGDQHDPTEMPAALYGASSWMTALLSDSLRRAYATAEDLPSAHMIRRSGTFLKTSLRNQVGGYNGEVTWAPRYIIEWDGTDFAPEVQEADPLHEEEHALETTSALAWADYFGALVNQRDATLASIVADVYDTYDLGVNNWIRPTAPASAGLAAFRVTPPRKWGWEHRTSDGLSWAIAAASAPAELPVFANGFETP